MCDAALRPRGIAAGGPREAQEAHRARTCGRRPRVSTRPADARVGRHMAGGVSIWRAHRLVGPCKFTGAVTQMLTAPLHYICASAIYFFRVGLYPHGNYLCRTRGATRGVGFDREEERFIDRVDPSPRDQQSRHVLKKIA